ncbi:hypothetical protein SRHO_G00305860 [Serrasalmus rhombeus]
MWRRPGQVIGGTLQSVIGGLSRQQKLKSHHNAFMDIYPGAAAATFAEMVVVDAQLRFKSGQAAIPDYKGERG